MVKPKTQIKTAVKGKSKTEISSEAIASRPTEKAVIERQESNDILKPSRESAQAEQLEAQEKIEVETLENKIRMVGKSNSKTSVGVNEIAKAVMAVKDSNPLSAKITRVKAVKEGKPAQPKDSDKASLAPQDIEARRLRLKNLIVQGKERGYLTYAEINDHLPDDMLDAEQIENIISMINDVGISVDDEAPDAETLLMSETAPTVADEDVVEEAEAALSTVDSEFGRTTDPVRMYMREMGSVELLTRESEMRSPNVSRMG